MADDIKLPDQKLTALEKSVLVDILSGLKKYEICAKEKISMAQLNAMLQKCDYTKMALDQVTINALSDAANISSTLDKADFSKIHPIDLIKMRKDSLETAERAIKLKDNRPQHTVNILTIINQNSQDSKNHKDIVEVEAISDEEFEKINGAVK